MEDVTDAQPLAVPADTTRMPLPLLALSGCNLDVAHFFCALAAWAWAVGDLHWWDPLEEVTLVLIELAEREGHALERIEIWSGTAAASGRRLGAAALPS